VARDRAVQLWSAATSWESGVARMAVEHGGHLHVGLEDWSGPGCPTNDDLVTAGVAVCQDAGRPVASPAETVELLVAERGRVSALSHRAPLAQVGLRRDEASSARLPSLADRG
jgi:hypothetical protein